MLGSLSNNRIDPNIYEVGGGGGVKLYHQVLSNLLITNNDRGASSRFVSEFQVLLLASEILGFVLISNRIVFLPLSHDLGLFQ